MNVKIDQRAVEALLRGQGCATSVMTLLQNPEIGSVSTEPLLNTILDSFSLALSFFDSPNSPPQLGSSSQNQAVHVHLQSSKKKIQGVKDREYYRDDSPIPRLEDGYFWRKYGQKTIKTSPHQRCYYRCTYAKDRNCNARKQVQKIKNNPPVYRTTYVGQHMCVADDTYGSKMMRFDHVLSDSSLPQLDFTMRDKPTNHMLQLVSTDNKSITMEDKVTDHVLNSISGFLMEDEQFSVSDLPLSSPEDMMFLDKIPVSN